MSKFINAIHEQLSGRKKALLQPLSAAIYQLEPDSLSVHTIPEYRFSVEWEARGFCEAADLQALRGNMLRELQEAVYGDLRERIIQIERAVYEQDRDALLMHTRALVREVFGQ